MRILLLSFILSTALAVPVYAQQDPRDMSARLADIEADLAQVLRVINNIPTAQGDSKQSANLRFRLGQIEEILRNINGKTDRMTRDIGQIKQTQEASQINIEARLQAIETRLSYMSELEQSPSAPPRVLGTIKTPEKIDQIPVETATITTKIDANDPNIINQPLIGESPLPNDAGINIANDPRIIYERGKEDLLKGDYRRAQVKFSRLLSSFPAHPLAGNAQYWLGETHYVRKNYKKAAEAFIIGYTKYAKSNKASDSLLKLGMTLHALGDSKRSCDAFAELAARFPNASNAIAQRAKIEKNRAGCN